MLLLAALTGTNCSLLEHLWQDYSRQSNTIGVKSRGDFYALFLKALAACFPKAVKIRLVQDNLSTHNASSFYEHFSAHEAFELSERFELYYTPKSASWLNMIEIEFSALVKQCLDRRIATQQNLSEEIEPGGM